MMRNYFLLSCLLAGASVAHESTDATLWMQSTAEYPALVEQTYRLAAQQLPGMLGAPPRQGAIENTEDAVGKMPAIILDIDETVLDNGPWQALSIIQGAHTMGKDSWDQWIMAHKARALPGALDYVRYARKLGVEVFYVTNRRCTAPGNCPQQVATITNLRNLGFPDVDDGHVLMNREHRDWTSEKTGRRVSIAEKFRIVQIIGDDLADFIPGIKSAGLDQRVLLAAQNRFRFGQSWFLLPNPVYGSWKQALGQYPASFLRPDTESLCLKGYALIGWIQGPSTRSPCSGLSVTTTGVVSFALRQDGRTIGYFLQDPVGDANPDTSDGIFVRDPVSGSSLKQGDLISVRAHVHEEEGMTTLVPDGPNAVSVIARDQTVDRIPLPVSNLVSSNLESYEGMPVLMVGPLRVMGAERLHTHGYLVMQAIEASREHTATGSIMPGDRGATVSLAPAGRVESVLGILVQGWGPVTAPGAQNEYGLLPMASPEIMRQSHLHVFD